MTEAQTAFFDLPEFGRMADVLEATGRFKILRRLERRTCYVTPDGTPTQRGIFLDVETTGLDPATDQIIELAMVPFDFARDGRIFTVQESFERYRDPGRPIPPSVTELTGISDETVAGQAIDPAEVAAFIEGATIVVAHNAGFDRLFAERFCSAFAKVEWGCSWREIDWRSEGFTEGAKLTQLATAAGFFYSGHHAENDCRAGIEMLSRPLPRSGRLALDILLASIQTPRWRVWATGAPFDRKDTLKLRGYRWNDGADGHPRAWFMDVTAENLEGERQFLRRDVYRRESMPIDAHRIDAIDRYSERH